MRILLALIICCLVTGDIIAGMYKCIDKNGRIHFGDRALAECESIDFKPRAVPREDEVRRSQERLKRRLDYLRRSEEIRREDKDREIKENAEKKRKQVEYRERCIIAQQNYHALRQKRPVYSINEKGERVYLEDKARVVEMERIRTEIETYCK